MDITKVIDYIYIYIIYTRELSPALCANSWSFFSVYVSGFLCLSFLSLTLSVWYTSTLCRLSNCLLPVCFLSDVCIHSTSCLYLSAVCMLFVSLMSVICCLYACSLCGLSVSCLSVCDLLSSYTLSAVWMMSVYLLSVWLLGVCYLLSIYTLSPVCMTF